MSTVSEVHEEKETLSVDVEIPGHAPRGAATPLFIRTKRILMERMDGRCFICNGTEAERVDRLAQFLLFIPRLRQRASERVDDDGEYEQKNDNDAVKKSVRDLAHV